MKISKSLIFEFISSMIFENSDERQLDSQCIYNKCSRFYPKTMRNDHLLVSPSLTFRVQRMFYGSPNCAELYIRFHSVSMRFYFVESRLNIRSTIEENSEMELESQ